MLFVRALDSFDFATLAVSALQRLKLVFWLAALFVNAIFATLSLFRTSICVKVFVFVVEAPRPRIFAIHAHLYECCVDLYRGFASVGSIYKTRLRRLARLTSF